VVLHGARPERVELRVDAEVELAEAHEVTDGFGLAHFGQAGRLRALERAEGGRDVHRGHVERRDRRAGAAARVALENGELFELEALTRFSRHAAPTTACFERIAAGCVARCGACSRTSSTLRALLARALPSARCLRNRSWVSFVFLLLVAAVVAGVVRAFVL